MPPSAVGLALEAAGDDADPDRRDAAAISALALSARDRRAARTARRRRSISPPSAATATSCAAQIARRAGRRLPRCVGWRAAGRASPRWRWPAGSAPHRSPPDRHAAARLSASARTRRAIPDRHSRARCCSGRRGNRPAFRLNASARSAAAALTLAGGDAISVAELQAAQRGLAARLTWRLSLSDCFEGCAPWRWTRR